ncbi:MAG: aminopeptidase [Gammaproteobacteria bacterium]
MRFDGWFDARLNNARLAALASYDDEVPAFRALLAQDDGNLSQFYADVVQLASLKPEQRAERLHTLTASIAARSSVNESAAADSDCRAGY